MEKLKLSDFVHNISSMFMTLAAEHKSAITFAFPRIYTIGFTKSHVTKDN